MEVGGDIEWPEGQKDEEMKRGIERCKLGICLELDIGVRESFQKKRNGLQDIH